MSGGTVLSGRSLLASMTCSRNFRLAITETKSTPKSIRHATSSTPASRRRSIILRQLAGVPQSPVVSETTGLCGTPASCLRMIDRLRDAGVDEVACLIDFGVDFDSVMASLKFLEQVMLASNDRPDKTVPPDMAADVSFQEVFDRVTTRQILMNRQRQAKRA